VSVFQFDPKHGVRQGVDDLAIHFYLIFFCHNLSPKCKKANFSTKIA
jgi:hypothetical protein